MNSVFCYVVFIIIVVVSSKSLNKGYGRNLVLFEGDMMMTEEDVKTAELGGDVDSNGMSVGYSVNADNKKRWPGGIVPYDITGIKSGFMTIFGGTGITENAALNAMAEIEKHTCIRFKKRTNETDYINYIDGGHNQCYTRVGRVGGPQDVSLGFNCFYMGIAMHEILHVLGFHHEQSRPDRDQYIEIIWRNVYKSFRRQFHKYGHHIINSLGSPYDYDSIMHYKSNQGALYPWKTTIRAKQAGVTTVGQIDHLSKQDIWQINKLYHCQGQ